MVGTFLALYSALLVVGLGFGLAIALERGIAAVAVAGMGTMGEPVERVVTLEQDGGKVTYAISVAVGSQKSEGTLRHVFHAHNLLLFAALVLATPGLAARQRALALGSGLTLIFTLDVLITMGDIWTGENKSLGIDARTGGTWGLSQVGYVLRYLHPTGGAFMAPVFIWALALVGPLRRSVMQSLAAPKLSPAE